MLPFLLPKVFYRNDGIMETIHEIIFQDTNIWEFLIIVTNDSLRSAKFQQNGSSLGMKYTVVLVRHGESTWNKENRFTGWVDVPLSEKGEEEAKAGGKLLREAGYTFDVAYTSTLKRAIKTLWIVLEQMDLMYIPIVSTLPNFPSFLSIHHLESFFDKTIFPIAKKIGQ